MDKLIELFRPQHAAESLPHDLLEVIRNAMPGELIVELCSFLATLFNDVVKENFICERRIFVGFVRGEL